MDKRTFCLLEKYMLSCMEDSAHDKEHIYRVLFNALEIGKSESQVDYDILICSCLLHDIGRKEQFNNPQLCHAQVGAEKAYQFLKRNQFDEEYALAVKHCIYTHRFRKNAEPQSIEAKILFDADKLDVAGAIGIARSLIYRGIVAEPLYNLDCNGMVSNGEKDSQPSFFREYKYKLEKLYSHFYTERGAEMAKLRRQAAISFYENLLSEVTATYMGGREQLNSILEQTD